MPQDGRPPHAGSPRDAVFVNNLAPPCHQRTL